MGKKSSIHRISLNGLATVTLLDPFDREVAYHVAHNRIVAGGQRLLADLLLGRSTQALATIAVGSGDTEPTSDDTALAAEVYRKPIAEADKQIVGGNGQPFTVRLSITLGINEPPEGDVELREIGLFDAANGLFSRTLLPIPVIKTHNFTLSVRWEIEIG
ncbi:MAG: phage tail protein [Anaerolineae bacterium]|nr:phage tail protein [Anaerolineae bacterium]MDW8099653.1 phage tail protein [Anaerolineae bacterium]